MKHDHLNFIQIRRAIVEAGQDARLSADDVRGILDALPEPQDEWEECAFEDIQKGDTIKYETPDALIEPKHPVFRNFGDELVFVGDMKVWNHPDATFYRIPAPVEHPDPAEHPVIIVHLHNGVKETKRAFVWNGGSYGCFDAPHSFLAPRQITEWSPAKVVADNDC